MKRLFDIVFSIIALAVFSVPFIIIGIILVIKEKHTILFKQVRVGKDKTVFRIFKIQTMVNQIPTSTGRFLRKTGIDEWAQFINVLKGEMSIVGPRALTEYDIKRLGWDDSFHAKRWNIKPGITGFAQLYGGQHRKTSWFWDVYYLNNNNLCTDLVIIIISFLMNIFGKTRIRKIIFQKSNLK